jgi:hypothetical protein
MRAFLVAWRRDEKAETSETAEQEPALVEDEKSRDCYDRTSRQFDLWIEDILQRPHLKELPER